MKKSRFFFFLIFIIHIAGAQDINISFKPLLSGNLIDSIVVTNQYTNKKVKLQEGEILTLTDNATRIQSPVNEPETTHLFPNPCQGNTSFIFSSEKTEVVCLKVYNNSGQLIQQSGRILGRGFHRFNITLPFTGIYYLSFLKSSGPVGYKIVNTGRFPQRTSIDYAGNDIIQAKGQSTPLKSSPLNKTMNYTKGTILVSSVHSGMNNTIMADSPTADKTYSVEFKECIDVEKQHYPVVKIGNQWWMAKNLQTSKYNNGFAIPDFSQNSSWTNLIPASGGYCWVSNDAPANKESYGALYNWYAVSSGKICPPGWHAPSDEEWKQAEKSVGFSQEQADSAGWRGTVLGMSLKSNNGWQNGGNGTNASGFSALPAGWRDLNGTFIETGSSTGWWTFSEESSALAWYRYLGNARSGIKRSAENKVTGFCLRCVSNDDQRVLLDQPVSASSSVQTFSVPGVISVEIPGGVIAKSSRIRILTLSQDIPVSDEIKSFKPVGCFEVTIDGQNKFSNPLIITIPLGNEYLTDTLRRKALQSAFYNDSIRRWVAFSSTLVNQNTKTIRFETFHLTPLGVFEKLATGGYTDKFETPHYTVYYVTKGTHAVYEDLFYNDNITRPWHVAGYPKYVQDVAHYLEVADNVFRNTHKLTLPEKYDVYIRWNGGDGDFYPYGIYGTVIIMTNLITADIESPEVKKEDYVKMATAHELFHLAQDYYYSMLFAPVVGANQWFLESLASNGDGIVYQNQGTYESMMYARKKLVEGSAIYGQHVNLSRSWDDCNSQPNYYIAGNLLHYLSKRRNGTKLDLVRVMKNLGDLSGQLLFRHLLNNEIKSQIPETDLGKEFDSYVRYLAGNSNAGFRLIYPPVSNSQMTPEFYPCFDKIQFQTGDLVKSPSWTLPLLSAKLIMLYNDFDNENTQLEVKYRPLKGSSNVYLLNSEYGIQTNMTYDKLETLDFPKGAVYYLLIINSDLLSSSEIQISAEMKKTVNPDWTTGTYKMYVGAFLRFCPVDGVGIPYDHIPTGGGLGTIPVTISSGGAISFNWKNPDDENETCSGSGSITPTIKKDQYRFQLNFKWERKHSMFKGPFLAFESKTDKILTFSASDWHLYIKTPVSGKLTHVNYALDGTPTTCNKDITFSTFNMQWNSK